MPKRDNGDLGFVVSLSKAVDKVLRKLLRTAIARSQGKAFVLAYQQIFSRLRKDPTSLGEMSYRLPSLRLEVRTVVVAPLVIDFAVSEDHPIVYIKGGKLLSKPKK
jgi:hypothetical protein